MCVCGVTGELLAASCGCLDAYRGIYVQNTPVTNELFQDTWTKWKAKTYTVCVQWAKPGSVDMSVDDLMAVAQRVMLISLRKLDTERAQFSTFYYTNLYNAFHRLTTRGGYTPRRYRVEVQDRRTGRSELMDRRFETREEAWAIANDISGRRVGRVLDNSGPRQKRNPGYELSSLDAVLKSGEDNSDVNTYHDVVGHVDAATLGPAIHAVRRLVKDRVTRKILLLMVKGVPMSSKESPVFPVNSVLRSKNLWWARSARNVSVASAVEFTAQAVQRRLRRLEPLAKVIYQSV